MRLFLVVFAAAFWVGDLRPAPAPAARPRILFAARVDGVYQLFLIDEDGKNREQITREKTSCLSPCWSPDGQKIAFSMAPVKPTYIFTMDADGKNLKKLTADEAFDVQPAWSPDGKSIAFSRYTQGGAKLCLIGAGGGKVTALTPDSDAAFNPRWSPDGSKIAFSWSRSNGGWRPYVMDADGRNITALSHLGDGDSNSPTWSPDGKRIAYTDRTEWNGRQFFTVDTSGNDRKQLTKEGGCKRHLSWSPDGKKIALLQMDDDAREGSMYIMSVESGDLKKLADEVPLNGGSPSWRPRR